MGIQTRRINASTARILRFVLFGFVYGFGLSHFTQTFAADAPYGSIPDLNPPTPSPGTISTETSAEEFLIASLNYLLGFLGIVALLFIVYGGYLWITALGKEDQVGKAKKIITGAAIGIFIILASYAIVNSILTARQFLLPI